jgi:hypothetical protein
VVALLQPFEVQADPGEVAAIFEVPLVFLMDGQNHQRLSVELPAAAQLLRHAVREYYIWGAGRHAAQSVPFLACLGSVRYRSGHCSLALSKDVR